MALSTTQKAQIRFFLGYSDVSQGGSPNRLERAMTSITADGQTIVEGILTKLATVQTQLASSTFLAGVGLKSVDNGGVVWQDGAGSLQSAVSGVGRSLVAQLSAMFGVIPAADIFGTAFPTSGMMGLT